MRKGVDAVALKRTAAAEAQKAKFVGETFESLTARYLRETFQSRRSRSGIGPVGVRCAWWPRDPTDSCLTQIFKVPEPGFDPRGVDIDGNGVLWTALSASSHLASFDARNLALAGERMPERHPLWEQQ